MLSTAVAPYSKKARRVAGSFLPYPLLLIAILAVSCFGILHTVFGLVLLSAVRIVFGLILSTFIFCHCFVPPVMFWLHD